MSHVEPLEHRTLLASAGAGAGAGAPDIYEQYLVCLINRARANPAGETARYKVALNEGVPAEGQISPTPKQPLAINPSLQQAARDQSQWILDTDTFSHVGANGSTQHDRDSAVGYGFAMPTAWGENIGYSGQTRALPELIAAVERIHRNFIVDSGVDGRIHRTNILQDAFREVGAGLAGGSFSDPGGTMQAWMATQDFAYQAGNSFLTGVIFADTMRKDGFYTPYEGLGQVTITATSTTGSGAGAVYSTTSWDSGGYSLQVPSGTYRVTFSGGFLPAPIVRENIVVGSENVLQDVNATGMAGIPILKSGTLLVTGTPGDDQITLDNLGDRLRVTLNSGTWYAPRKSIKRIEVHGGAGNDAITIGPGLPAAKLYGEDGNDALAGGDGKDQLRGGAGDDTLDGQAGNDALYGEDGADSLFGGDGNDALYGGASNDTIFGGSGNDKLRGEDGDDRLDGEAGNDQLTGSLGADLLIGGPGTNTLSAKDKAPDTLVTGQGTDKLSRDTLLDIVTTIAP